MKDINLTTVDLFFGDQTIDDYTLSINFDDQSQLTNPFNKLQFVDRFFCDMPSQIDSILSDLILQLAAAGKVSSFTWTFDGYYDRFAVSKLNDVDVLMVKTLFSTHEYIRDFANKTACEKLIAAIHEKIDSFIKFKTFFATFTFENKYCKYETKGEFGYRPYGISDIKKNLKTVLYEFPLFGIGFSQMSSKFTLK